METTPTNPAPYLEARRRQGLPTSVTDPQVIARIAALLRRTKETPNGAL